MEGVSGAGFGAGEEWLAVCVEADGAAQFGQARVQGPGGPGIDGVHGLAQGVGAAAGPQVDEGGDGGGAGAVRGAVAAGDPQRPQHLDPHSRPLTGGRLAG